MKRLLISLTFLATVVVSAVAPAKQAAAIYGGEIVSQAYPWAVSFVYDSSAAPGLSVDDRITCSGTLVASQWVLTAAHCQLPRDSIQVVIGRRDVSNGLEGEKRRIAQSGTAHFRHGNYSGGPLSQYDVMLVKLDSPSTQQPLYVAGPGEEGYWQTDMDARFYGYGSTPSDNHFLKRVTKNILLDSNHYTLHTSGANICSGDSGGPVVVSTDVGPRVVGVLTGFEAPTGGNCTQAYYQQAAKVGWRGSDNNSPLYRWFYSTLILNGTTF